MRRDGPVDFPLPAFLFGGLGMRYKVGDTVYLIESNRLIRECTVKRVSGNLYVVRFANGGGIQVKEHRLFATQEEAESSRLVKKVAKTNYRSPYEYWH